jgi:phosphoenolpyruvate synthase/pyruvate phosphate dikinase
VNNIYHDLEVQEIQNEMFGKRQAREKKAFLEKWGIETNALNEQRHKINKERSGVRELLKRPRLSSAV